MDKNGSKGSHLWSQASQGPNTFEVLQETRHSFHLPRTYPAGFGQGLNEILSSWRPQPRLRQKREVDDPERSRALWINAIRWCLAWCWLSQCLSIPSLFQKGYHPSFVATFSREAGCRTWEALPKHLNSTTMLPNLHKHISISRYWSFLNIFERNCKKTNSAKSTQNHVKSTQIPAKVPKFKFLHCGHFGYLGKTEHICQKLDRP